MILALVGPTATGKSSIALELAPELNAEIVSVDSMTVYRGMDVGTAKPDADERRSVTHHLIDIADPSERFTVRKFQEHARGAIEEMRARGKQPFVVGGSGLYFRAVVDELEFPPESLGVRARLERESLEELALRLKEQDPDAAAFVDPKNKRRVVRALEVIELTGKPFSSFRDAWGRYKDVCVAGLELKAEELDRRIRARLAQQLADGFLDEVRSLVKNGYRDAITSTQAIPYREGLQLLDGTLDEDGFIEAGARANKRLARRQMSWFRKDPRVRWFDATEPQRTLEELRAYYA